MEEESSSDSGSSNGDEAAEEIEEDEMAMDIAQVIYKHTINTQELYSKSN